MSSNLIYVGVVVGVAASVPIVYQHNPAAFNSALGLVLRPHAERAAVIRTAAGGTGEAPAAALFGRKVRLTRNAAGHYAGEFRLNGRDVEALVDTGATFVAMDVSTARSIGIFPAPADFKYRVNTANGQTRAAAVTLDELQIGPIAVADVKALVLQDAALSATLVGMSFLNRLSSFRADGDTLVLEQ